MIKLNISLQNFIQGSKDFYSLIETLDISSYKIDGQTIYFDEKPIIKLDIKKVEGILRAKVECDIKIVQTCVKCLDSFKTKAVIKYEGILASEDNMDTEGLILMDEYDLDLLNLLDIALIEHIQSNTHCKSDCKGLCQTCGINLNHEDCNCKDTIININPEFEKLKKLSFN